MSKEGQNQGSGDELAALRSELAQSRQENAEAKAQMAEMGCRLDALASRRQPYEGDQRPVNVNLPDGRKASQAIYERLTSQIDSRCEAGEQGLSEGPRKFRICIRDQQNLKRLERLESVRKGGSVPPWEWDFNPFNPWRTVGGRDEAEARFKYNAHFGIRGIADGADYVVYEVDAEGQPLALVTA